MIALVHIDRGDWDTTSRKQRDPVECVSHHRIPINADKNPICTVPTGLKRNKARGEKAS